MPSEDTQFKPGHPGGPGRPKGSRNKLSQAFIDALCEDFTDNPEVLAILRTENPAAYANVIAKIIPKELDIDMKADATVTKIVKEYVDSKG